MGASDSGLNCTPSWTDFEPNGDIVGIGVLVAFFATAVATVGAIIFGYLTESFPESYFNDVDLYAIAAYKKSKLSKAISWISRGLHTFKDGLKSLLGFEVTTPHRISRKERQEALSRFILTLSDQQLVTGLAILVGAVANQRVLSVYEFSVALSLAWFSSTTHLATLDALAEYFLEHGVVRNWRVGGMLSLLTLLSYCLLLVMFAQSSVDPTAPIQCFLSTTHPIPNFTTDPFFTMSLISTLLTLYILYLGYADRIRALYHRTAFDKLKSQFALAEKLPRFFKINSQIGPKAPDRAEVLAEVRASERLRSLKRIMKASAKSKWTAKLLTSSYQYNGSFLASMSDTAFSISYGISQVIAYRWLDDGVPTGNGAAIDFGQITPLFLLVLPILVAAEIYYESKDGKKASSTHQQDESTIEEKAQPAVSSNQHTGTLTPSAITSDAQKYKENIPNMKKYLYREIKDIQKQEASAATAPELASVLVCKTQLLSKFEQFRAFEESLDRFPAILRATVDVFISMVLGIMLNVNSVQANVVAYVLFFPRFAYMIGKIFYKINYYRAKEDQAIANQVADRELIGQGEEDGLVASEK
ncbi:hypothetical protein V8E51_007610 [Hyaloscypha variabilis]